jgi:hypothetical protein
MSCQTQDLNVPHCIPIYFYLTQSKQRFGTDIISYLHEIPLRQKYGQRLPISWKNVEIFDRHRRLFAPDMIRCRLGTRSFIPTSDVTKIILKKERKSKLIRSNKRACSSQPQYFDTENWLSAEFSEVPK